MNRTVLTFSVYKNDNRSFDQWCLNSLGVCNTLFFRITKKIVFSLKHLFIQLFFDSTLTRTELTINTVLIH
jgi:hypothetical protein